MNFEKLRSQVPVMPLAPGHWICWIESGFGRFCWPEVRECNGEDY
jgi:hypothetical protein